MEGGEEPRARREAPQSRCAVTPGLVTLAASRCLRRKEALHARGEDQEALQDQ